ncbi:MAG TPA: glycosyltransferase family 39 protein [Leptolyngbyaceae cyanobacterium M65_K2018_010]|nr:glycosyltransferase family 39 protein [Leptolyngbyaceae cyanobacterium M65_K2018_010]
MSTPAGGGTGLPPREAARRRDGLILVGLWLVVAIADGVWMLSDQAPPAWDQGEHLTRVLNFWRVLQHPAWGEGDWWTTLWRQSPGYRAPLVYLATVPLFNLLGRGFEQAVLVNTLFAGLLMALLYELGRYLFDRQTGLWAAGLSLLVPMLYALRLDYLLDFGLVVCVVAAFACLTRWRGARPQERWWWALGFGICLGGSILAKPTAVMFLLVPLGWVAVESLLKPPRWAHGLQWAVAAAAMVLVCGPWIQTNWLTILTNSQSNNASWIPAEVVPGSRGSALSYYARMLPRLITYALLVTGSLGGLAGLAQAYRRDRGGRLGSSILLKWAWLSSFLLGSYGLLTLLQNKDPRHFAPAVPILVLVLARGLTCLSGRAGRWLRGFLAGLMTALMVATLLPGGPLPPSRLMRSMDLGPAWPHAAVIETVLEQDPYLRSTLGVLPNTAQINPHTFDFYGALRDFRVFGRELGFNPASVPLDLRSLTWMMTKTGDQGPTTESKQALSDAVVQSPEFEVTRTWSLPDGSELALHRRRQPAVTVTPLAEPTETIQLAVLSLPRAAAPGQTVPVTYAITGAWEALQHGLLVLSWQPAETTQARTSWIHDHGIGLGQLLTDPDSRATPLACTVTEHLGMRLPVDLAPGTYSLKAEYVDRQTGQSQPLNLAPTTLTIAADLAPVPHPAPDLVGELHQLSQGLVRGDLDPIFATVGRINQYDPVQDYLTQAIVAMDHRLASDPENSQWLYTKVMAQVLQQDAPGAITTLKRLTTLTPENIYHWLFLGFVHLYAWQPRQANLALDQAAQLDSTMPELKVLQGVAALQQLRLRQAWQRLQESGLLN